MFGIVPCKLALVCPAGQAHLALKVLNRTRTSVGSAIILAYFSSLSSPAHLVLAMRLTRGWDDVSLCAVAVAFNLYNLSIALL